MSSKHAADSVRDNSGGRSTADESLIRRARGVSQRPFLPAPGGGRSMDTTPLMRPRRTITSHSCEQQPSQLRTIAFCESCPPVRLSVPCDATGSPPGREYLQHWTNRCRGWQDQRKPSIPGFVVWNAAIFCSPQVFPLPQTTHKAIWDYCAYLATLAISSSGHTTSTGWPSRPATTCATWSRLLVHALTTTMEYPSLVEGSVGSFRTSLITD